MKKRINIRNGIITVLCITVICMGIGFIVLSVELKKEKDEINKFDVSFTKIRKISSVKGGNITPAGEVELSNNDKEINMNFTLSAVHDELSYVATIKNKGTLPAEIIDIVESPDYSIKEFNNIIRPVTVTLSDIEGKIIPAGDEMELKVTIYYNPIQDKAVKKNFNYKIGLVTKSR